MHSYGKPQFEPLTLPLSPSTCGWRNCIFALIALALLFAFAACEGQTITIEESTEEADGSRTVRVSSSGADGTPGPTATPRPRIEFQPESEGAALTALFDATDGEGWGDSDGWLYIEDLGQWHGVTTDAEGRVTALDLGGNGLSGTLPDEIGLLTELTELDLSNNGLSGSLPAEVGNLASLEELYLNGNQFSGALPVSLGGLANLEDLHLHDNGFGAEFPAALGELSSLESVTLWGNKFTWADSYVPGIVADMVGLVALYESAGGDNWPERSGWLSDPSVAAWSGVSIGGDGSVTGLELSGNGLSGEIPPQIGGLVGLTALDLSGNQLEGEIPESIGHRPPQLGGLVGLNTLDLSGNRLEGEIPESIGSLTALTMLSLHSNQLGGNLPDGIGGMADLEELHLHSNRFSGPVPAELGNLGNLEVLWLHDNQFSGELPGELANISSLERVSLWGNNLEWAETYTPGIVADMVGLLALYESASGENWRDSTHWHTTVPVGEWQGVTTFGLGAPVTNLELGSAGLIGELPSQLGNMTGLETLILSNNQLTGEIPVELGSLVNLTQLTLNNNQLTGEIPAELGRLSNLTTLRLENNGLTGAIPAALGNLAKLTELTLNTNRLTGPVPLELGGLSNLETLYLDNNRLSGEFPSELGNLAGLQHASIWGNDLTWADSYANGYLADLVGLVALYQSSYGEEWVDCRVSSGCLGKFVSNSWFSYSPLEEWAFVTTEGPGGRVIGLDFTGRTFTSTGASFTDGRGELPAALGLLSGLKRLDIKGAGLTGEIPPELGRLSDLTFLYLANNHFSGPMPAELGNLTSLKELMLQNNRLSGPVPAELGNLSNLTLLYLDNNRLSGEFPSELGNLAKLQEASIWGNELTWADSYANGYLSDLVGLVALYQSAHGEEWVDCRVSSGCLGKFVSNSWFSYSPLDEWAFVTTEGPGGRVIRLDFNGLIFTSDGIYKIGRRGKGELPAALGLLSGLRKLDIRNLDGLSGCVPTNLSGIEYEGEQPFCTGATSKKALTPAGQGLLG